MNQLQKNKVFNLTYVHDKLDYLQDICLSVVLMRKKELVEKLLRSSLLRRAGSWTIRKVY